MAIQQGRREERTGGVPFAVRRGFFRRENEAGGHVQLLIMVQDAQNGCPARPQQVRGRGVHYLVRRALERSENAAGNRFQHPVT